MYTKIDEKIKVIALFENGKIFPKIFRWDNRDYKVKSVSLYYQEKLGASVNHLFAVESEDGGVFKVKFNDRSLVWELEEVWNDK